jgi:hypothetical protein
MTGYTGKPVDFCLVTNLGHLRAPGCPDKGCPDKFVRRKKSRTLYSFIVDTWRRYHGTYCRNTTKATGLFSILIEQETPRDGPIEHDPEFLRVREEVEVIRSVVN